ncbi:hypothetical protein AB0910_26800 [Streptomyces sp. NPDC047002]|uniref:hypothetical protein n=1 Tax=Streptomyces sp. NPDC047002 TaxID=3155475 RepID=UPI0034547B25
MDSRTRIRTALLSAVPTLLTLPAVCVLAAFGVVPWALLLCVPAALAVHAGVSFARLKGRPRETGPGSPGHV